MEIWRKVEDYEDYEVSDSGNIRSLKFGKTYIMKQNTNRTGYLYVNLFNNESCRKFEVHRLVAKAFCENKDSIKNICDHINRNKKDNRKENLRWVTCSINQLNKELSNRFNEFISLLIKSLKEGQSIENIQLSLKKEFSIRKKRKKPSPARFINKVSHLNKKAY